MFLVCYEHVTRAWLRRRYVPLNAPVLIVKPEWSRRIFDYGKTIEVRSTRTYKRGTVYVTESGSYFIVGKMEIWECEGPLSEARWEELRPLHQVRGKRMYGASTFAWYLRSASRVATCVPCARTTQVIWVRYAPVCNALWCVH